MKAVTPFSTCRRALVLCECVCGTFWVIVGGLGDPRPSPRVEAQGGAHVCECMYVCVCECETPS